MPSYNAVKTLERTLYDLPPGYVDEIILVDDCSMDNTVEVVKRLGLVVLEHEKNGGYGANQKTCYDEALKRGADIVIMLHPDYQYDSRLVPESHISPPHPLHDERSIALFCNIIIILNASITGNQLQIKTRSLQNCAKVSADGIVQLKYLLLYIYYCFFYFKYTGANKP